MTPMIWLRDWRGPLEVEVMRDHHGDYQLIEINPRFPAWIYLSAGVGRNLPLMLLQLSDRFVARISPRKGRKGLSARAAVRAHYLEMQRQNCPLGELLVKHLGLYLPGSYVRLQSNEIAVVTRSTAHANQPMVMAIVGKDGIPLSTPLVRDTALPQYAVLDSVPPDQVKVRLNPARVFARG